MPSSVYAQTNQGICRKPSSHLTLPGYPSQPCFSATPLVPYVCIKLILGSLSKCANSPWGNICGGFVLIPGGSVPSNGVCRHAGSNYLPYILFRRENAANHQEIEVQYFAASLRPRRESDPDPRWPIQDGGQVLTETCCPGNHLISFASVQ